MLVQLTSLAVLLGVASAGVVLGGLSQGVGLVGGAHGVVDLQTPPHYEFKYGVEDPKTGDRKQQSEVRVNDVVKGQYSLAEPDGTIRVVKYTADDHNGFNAVVSRIGHAAHPQVLIKKAVVPVAHAIPVATHGISVGGLGLGGVGLGGVGLGGVGLGGVGLGGIGLGGIGLRGGLLDGRGSILDGRDGLLDGRGILSGSLLGGHGGIGL